MKIKQFLQYIYKLTCKNLFKSVKRNCSRSHDSIIFQNMEFLFLFSIMKPLGLEKGSCDGGNAFCSFHAEFLWSYEFC